MKFNSFDELIDFLHGKDFSLLDFNITDASACTDCDDTETKVDNPESTDTIDVTFNSFSDSPVVEFHSGDASILVVEDFEHIPNTCSTTKINICGREVTMGICENADGLPVAKFDVSINGKLYTSKEFTLVTDKTLKNTINF